MCDKSEVKSTNISIVEPMSSNGFILCTFDSYKIKLVEVNTFRQPTTTKTTVAINYSSEILIESVGLYWVSQVVPLSCPKNQEYILQKVNNSL